jgi:hypothetical protein
MSQEEKAIEIATMLGDSVVDVKHCIDPRGGKVSRKTWTLLGVGAACLVASCVAFAVSVSVAAANQRALEYWTHVLHKPVYAFRPEAVSGALDWFMAGGLAIGLTAVVAGLLRVRDDKRSPYFRIGTAPGVELPVDHAPAASFPLVAPNGDDFLFHYAPGIDGELVLDGKTTPLAELAAAGISRPSPMLAGAFEMPIPARARIRARAGKASVLVSAVDRPRRHVVPLVAAFESRVMTYFAGSLAAHLGLWALLQIIPLEGGAANADLAMSENVSTRTAGTTNEVAPPPPSDGTGGEGQDGGDTPAPGTEGAAGTKMAMEDNAPHIQIKDRDASPQLSREEAIQMARTSGLMSSMTAMSEGITSVAATENFASGFSTYDQPGSVFDGTGDGGMGFGIGRTGFGAGGGGSCDIWCGTSVGRYATHGAGLHAGTGYGFAGGHGPGLPGHHGGVPQPRVGEAHLIGEYDKSIIRRYIKRNIDKIAYCYEHELLAHPGLVGEVQVQFFIQPNGTVRGSVGKGFDATVASCVADVVGQIAFPAPPDGGGIQVNYPFNFRPAAQ